MVARNATLASFRLFKCAIFFVPSVEEFPFPLKISKFSLPEPTVFRPDHGIPTNATSNGFGTMLRERDARDGLV